MVRDPIAVGSSGPTLFASRVARRRSSEAAIPDDVRIALRAFICRAFSVGELRRFVREGPDGEERAWDLPQGSVAIAQIAEALVGQIERRGELREVLVRLLETRPFRRTELHEIACACDWGEEEPWVDQEVEEPGVADVESAVAELPVEPARDLTGFLPEMSDDESEPTLRAFALGVVPTPPAATTLLAVLAFAGRVDSESPEDESTTQGRSPLESAEPKAGGTSIAMQSGASPDEPTVPNRANGDATVASRAPDPVAAGLGRAAFSNDLLPEDLALPTGASSYIDPFEPTVRSEALENTPTAPAGLPDALRSPTSVPRQAFAGRVDSEAESPDVRRQPTPPVSSPLSEEPTEPRSTGDDTAPRRSALASYADAQLDVPDPPIESTERSAGRGALGGLLVVVGAGLILARMGVGRALIVGRPSEPGAELRLSEVLPELPAPRLSPISRHLRVESVPPGADVRLAGMIVGKTPLHVEVPSGQAVRLEYKNRANELDVSRLAFDRYIWCIDANILEPPDPSGDPCESEPRDDALDQNVSVMESPKGPDDTTALAPVAERVEHRHFVLVMSVPPGAGIELNGAFQAYTPHSLQLASGSYTLALGLGDDTIERQVKVGPFARGYVWCVGEGSWKSTNSTDWQEAGSICVGP